MEDNWIKIYEYNKLKNQEENWLTQILKEEKIPYKCEVQSYWTGSFKRPSYNEKNVIYIPIKFRTKVEYYINENNNPNNMIIEDIKEFEDVEDDKTIEDDAQKINKKQKTMIRGVTIIILIMVVSMLLCGIIFQ